MDAMCNNHDTALPRSVEATNDNRIKLLDCPMDLLWILCVGDVVRFVDNDHVGAEAGHAAIKGGGIDLPAKCRREVIRPRMTGRDASGKY